MLLLLLVVVQVLLHGRCHWQCYYYRDFRAVTVQHGAARKPFEFGQGVQPVKHSTLVVHVCGRRELRLTGSLHPPSASSLNVTGNTLR